MCINITGLLALLCSSCPCFVWEENSLQPRPSCTNQDIPLADHDLLRGGRGQQRGDTGRRRRLHCQCHLALREHGLSSCHLQQFLSVCHPHWHHSTPCQRHTSLAHRPVGPWSDLTSSNHLFFQALIVSIFPEGTMKSRPPSHLFFWGFFWRRVIIQSMEFPGKVWRWWWCEGKWRKSMASYLLRRLVYPPPRQVPTAQLEFGDRAGLWYKLFVMCLSVAARCRCRVVCSCHL